MIFFHIELVEAVILLYPVQSSPVLLLNSDFVDFGWLQSVMTFVFWLHCLHIFAFTCSPISSQNLRVLAIY